MLFTASLAAILALASAAPAATAPCANTTSFYLRATSGDSAPAGFVQAVPYSNFQVSNVYTLFTNATLAKATKFTMQNTTSLPGDSQKLLAFKVGKTQYTGNSIVYSQQQYSNFLMSNESQEASGSSSGDTVAGCKQTGTKAKPVLTCNTGRYTTFYQDYPYLYIGTAGGQSGTGLVSVTLTPTCKTSS